MNGEMNKCEKENLIEKSKKALRREFVSMEGEGWKQYNEYIKSSDMLEALSVLLNATREEEEIECSFSNEYIDMENPHRFFIHGEEEICINYDNVLDITPTNSFSYWYQGEEVTDYFVSNMNVIGVDSYSGKFIYSGIINEESAYAGFVDLSSAILTSRIIIYTFDENSAAWKRYFAESYRLYKSGQYKLAFLHAFIGFESQIEYINGIIYDVYLDEQNQMLKFEFEECNKLCYPPITLLEEFVLGSESYKRMKHLKKENRSLIDDKLVTVLKYVNDLETKSANNKVKKFKFFEKLRNILAHGDSLERDDFKKERLYNKYYCNKEKSFDFQTAYVDFFECIGILIKELIK